MPKHIKAAASFFLSLFFCIQTSNLSAQNNTTYSKEVQAKIKQFENNLGLWVQIGDQHWPGIYSKRSFTSANNRYSIHCLICYSAMNMVLSGCKRRKNLSSLGGVAEVDTIGIYKIAISQMSAAENFVNYRCG